MSEEGDEAKRVLREKGYNTNGMLESDAIRRAKNLKGLSWWEKLFGRSSKK